MCMQRLFASCQSNVQHSMFSKDWILWAIPGTYQSSSKRLETVSSNYWLLPCPVHWVLEILSVLAVLQILYYRGWERSCCPCMVTCLAWPGNSIPIYLGWQILYWVVLQSNTKAQFPKNEENATFTFILFVISLLEQMLFDCLDTIVR